MSAVAARTASTLSREGARAVVIAIALVCLAAAVGIAISLVDAAGVREWLGFSFPGVAVRFGEVVAILANNLGMLAAVFVACGVVQLGREVAVADGSGGATGRVAKWSARVLAYLCDAAVAASAIGHAVIIGAGVGAYGETMIVALLPHGPLELGAYSLALALYVAARRGPIERGRWAAVGVVCVLGLAVAAPVEVYLGL
jgi:hypothetical protein